MNARNLLTLLKMNPAGPIWEPADLGANNEHWERELKKRAEASTLEVLNYRNNPAPCEVLFVYEDGTVVHARCDEIRTLMQKRRLLCVMAVFPAVVKKLQLTPFLELMGQEAEPA